MPQRTPKSVESERSCISVGSFRTANGFWCDFRCAHDINNTASALFKNRKKFNLIIRSSVDCFPGGGDTKLIIKQYYGSEEG
jgi:hypothetical protein